MRWLLTTILILFIGVRTFALVIGSNTAVSRQSVATFPPTDSDNTMLGFASMDGGFTVSTFNTTCTYDAFFPVSGPVYLEQGILVLTRDLDLAEPSYLASMGHIVGNSHALHAHTTVTSITPASDCIFKRIDRSSLASGSFTDLDWAYDNAYIVASLSSVSTGQLRIFQYNGTTLTLTVSYMLGRDATACAHHPFSRFIAVGLTAGPQELRMLQHVTATGTITLLQGVDITDDQAISSLDWHPTGSYLAVGRTVIAPTGKTEIFIYSCSATGTLTQVATADIAPDQSVGSQGLSWDSAGNYLAVGLLNTPNSGTTQLNVYYFNGTSLTLTVSQSPGVGVQAVDWSPSGTYIATGLTTTGNALRVYQHTLSNGTLSEAQSARVGEGAAVFTTQWGPSGNHLWVGLDFPGTSTVIRYYSFDKTAKTLSACTVGKEVNDVIAIVRNTSSGTAAFIIPSALSVTTVLSYYELTNINMVLDAPYVRVNAPLNFLGVSTILGAPTVLDLANTGSIFVGTNGKLKLKNVAILGAKQGALSCLDVTGTLQLDNVVISLDNNLSWSFGRFEVLNDLTFRGTNAFIYASSVPSFIDSGVTVLFDSGTSFSYNPPVASSVLLTMSTRSSRLVFSNADIFSTTTGLALTKGTLLIDGNCRLASRATVAAQGIVFGDGSSANDLNVIVNPDASLEIISGILVSKNVL